MSEEKGNRVMVTDSDDVVKRIRTEDEIVKENDELENQLKEKTQKQKLEDILKEKKELRKKQKSEDSDMTVMLVEQQDRSVNLGVVGVGQCGSKIAEEFYERGYNVVAINTAMQDLKFINIPEKQKLFLDISIGGAGKDRSVGKDAVEQYENEVVKHIETYTEDCEILMLVVSGGGGTGAGSAETMCNLMAGLGKPVVVLFVLPMSSESVIAKHNALQTLSELAQLATEDVINSLMVVDNSKIEMIYSGLSMKDFWTTANKAIVEPLHLFNELSSQPSAYDSLDPTDFVSIVLEADFLLYGMIEVENYLEEDAIAEAIITNTESGLLSSDFDLTQTRSAGVIITGSGKVLEQIPAANMEYGFSVLSKLGGDAVKIYRGIYEIEGHPDCLRVYSLFAGLGLPEDKVNELKADAQKHMDMLDNKKASRATNMKIDLGKTKAVSAADRIHDRIKNKNSGIGKLMKNTKKVIDKRRR